MPCAIVVAGTPDAPAIAEAVAEAVDLVTKSACTVVHLRVLPDSASDYAAAILHATASA